MKFKKALQKAKDGKDVYRLVDATHTRYLYIDKDEHVSVRSVHNATGEVVWGILKSDVDADTWRMEIEFGEIP